MSYSPDLTQAAIKMAASLVVVLIMLWGLYRVARKVMPAARGTGGGKMINIVENHYLGIKKNILMVHVPGALLVLGVTADKIQLLTRIKDPEIIEAITAENTQNAFAGSSFKSQLQKFLGSNSAASHSSGQATIVE